MFLQMTSRNAIVTYSTISSAVLATPQIIEGWADDSFLTINLIDNVEVKKSLDNITYGYVKPVVMEGRLKLLPNSPGQQVFQQVQTFQTLSAIVAPGSLTVTYPGLLTSISYKNFVLTSPFEGYGIGERVENVEISFKCDLPNTSVLNELLQLGLASIGSF